jgi:hypothetical protein
VIQHNVPPARCGAGLLCGERQHAVEAPGIQDGPMRSAVARFWAHRHATSLICGAISALTFDQHRAGPLPGRKEAL